MVLDLEIRALLRSPTIAPINFRFGTYVVNSHGFRELAECFSDRPQRHRIRVTTNPAIVSRRASAAYDPVRDKLNVRSEDVLATASGRGNVVHECTHAQFDLRAYRTMALDEESCAFITKAWYLLNCGENIGDPVFDFADPVQDIALAFVARQSRAGRGSQVVATGAEMSTLRQTMRQDYRYRNIEYRSTGIRGRRLRPPRVLPNPYRPSQD